MARFAGNAAARHIKKTMKREDITNMIIVTMTYPFILIMYSLHYIITTIADIFIKAGNLLWPKKK